MKEYDKKQQEVIDFYGGHALVLAAPGCGKTEILSQRILKAHNYYGVQYQVQDLYGILTMLII